MKLLVDMNLSPGWCDVLERSGHEAVHWSSIGSHKAPDQDIMAWARSNGTVLFTHDLDFGAILAASNERGPSVLQVRSQDVTPESMSAQVLSALAQFSDSLIRGAIVVVEPHHLRARVLPLRPDSTE